MRLSYDPHSPHRRARDMSAAIAPEKIVFEPEDDRLYKDWLAELRRRFGVACFGSLQSRADTASFLRPNARSGSN